MIPVIQHSQEEVGLKWAMLRTPQMKEIQKLWPQDNIIFISK